MSNGMLPPSVREMLGLFKCLNVNPNQESLLLKITEELKSKKDF